MKSRHKIQLERAAKTGGAPVGFALTISTRPLLVARLLPALIAVVTFAAFLPTLQNGFVNWDDQSHLVENPHYRGLGWAQLHWMFTTCFNGSCMPLNWVTYGLDYLVWGMNPAGYHFTSLLVHVANGVVFYFLSLRLLRLALESPGILSNVPVRLAAAFSALLFSLHPLQVEVVAWATGREIAIAGFFFILTLICYLRAAENDSAESSRRRWMGAAWIFYALSLLGKEAALTLPFALLVLDVYPLKRLSGTQGKSLAPQVRRIAWEKVPFLLLALAAGIRGTLEKQQAGSFYPLASYDLAARLAQVLYSLAFYPWKVVFPAGLSPLYPVHPFTGLWSWPVLVSGAVVVSLSVGFFIARRRWPGGLAAWCFYGTLLLPVSGILAFGPYVAADRFSYLPSLGWPVLAGAGLFYFWKLWVGGRIGVRKLVFTQTVALLLLIGLGALSWNQTHVWKNSDTLWRHALSIDEESSFAHNNLGLVLAERGALDEAIGEFRRAVQIDPAFVEAQTNLGVFLARQGSAEEAIDHLRQALKIEPAFANAHNTLGNILADRGDLDGAVEHFRKALQTNPGSAMTHYNLGRALAQQGDLEGAVAHYRNALELNPLDPDAHNNLGLVFERQGKLTEALEQFRAAIRVEPKHAKAYFNLGKTLARKGDLNEAVQNFQKALQFQPGVAEIHENLARVLAQLGRKQEAVQHFNAALQILQSGSQPNRER